LATTENTLNRESASGEPMMEMNFLRWAQFAPGGTVLLFIKARERSLKLGKDELLVRPGNRRVDADLFDVVKKISL
jgi:hypothetical protein